MGILGPWRRSLAVLATTAATVASAALVAAVSPAAQAQASGFQTSGTQLLDANGNPFIFRGTNLPHVWFQNQFRMFADVAELGANSARVVLGSGQHPDGWGPNSPADVANVVAECKRLQMICMLEVHDAIGYEDGQNVVSVNDVVEQYWGDPAMVEALQGEEAYVLINIANEYRGNVNVDAWVGETIQAVQGMRELGYTHTLVVDAPNWGQDWTNTMRDPANAQQVAEADPLGNTLFSIHMYGVYGTPQDVIGYFDGFAATGLPLVVGEFGHVNDVAYETIMSEAQARGIGWLAWSWSGNTDPVLDQAVNFDPNNLTSGGQAIFNGPNGIVETAQTATVFEDPPPTTPPPTTEPPPTTTPPTTEPPPTTTPPPGGDCSVNYQANNWGGDPGFTASVTITNSGSSPIEGWTLAWSYPAGQTVEEPGWNAAISQTGSNVTATNAGWNATIAPAESVNFGFNGRASAVSNNPPPIEFTLNGSSCTTS